MQIAAFANALHAQRCCPPCVPPPRAGITLLSSRLILTNSVDGAFATNFDEAYRQLTQQSTGNVDWPSAIGDAPGGGIVPMEWENVAGADQADVFLSEVTTLQAAPTSIGLDPSFAEIVPVARQSTVTGHHWVYAYDHTPLPTECRPLIAGTVTSEDGSTENFVFPLGQTITYVAYNSATQRAVVRRSAVLQFKVEAGDCVEASASLAATAFTLGCGGERRTYGLDRARSTGRNIVAHGSKDQGTGQPLVRDGVLRVSAATCD